MSIWKKILTAIKAIEESADYNPYEQAIIVNQRRIAALEAKINELESTKGHLQAASKP